MSKRNRNTFIASDSEENSNNELEEVRHLIL